MFGGYPRVIITEDKKEKEIVLKNIYNTYFLKEIKEILNLPDDYMLSRLLNYTNKRTELVKAPKIFFLDNGFRNIVVKNFQPLENRQDKGFLYENFVATELVKAGFDVRYWRSKSKAEVDFVVEKSGEIAPLEIKSILSEPKITKSFHSFVGHYKPKTGYVLSEKLWKDTGKVKFRPVFFVESLFRKYKFL
ncbi:MAG: DUF4143 domain-containing protein [Candidatus Aenigmarchaeota archaeon]|nr:DUF4143 domain-containing protein [Candidatus Aenigmarchaeota archaeon]